MKMTIKILVLLGILITPFWFVDNHEFNIPYILWKKRYVDSHESKFIYFNVDTGFRQSFIGKSKEELFKYFPDAYPISESNFSQKHYVQFFKTKNAFWLGDTSWAAEVSDDGIILEFVIMKG